MEKLRVIVGCEFSQIVMTAFLKKGHDAYSCDIIPCEGNYPERHFQEDILQLLKREKFDLGIFHPPCTYLSNAGGHYLKTKPGRMNKMREAVKFFLTLMESDIEKIAIENPIQHGEARKLIPIYNQKVQPYYFGESEKKTICLWLKNLPPLVSTCIVPVKPKGKINKSDGRNYYYWHHQGKSAKERARFFKSIANAMADQWG